MSIYVDNQWYILGLYKQYTDYQQEIQIRLLVCENRADFSVQDVFWSGVELGLDKKLLISLILINSMLGYFFNKK